MAAHPHVLDMRRAPVAAPASSWWTEPRTRAEFDARVADERDRMSRSRSAMHTGWEDECQPLRRRSNGLKLARALAETCRKEEA